jgi:hypothetical protein
MWPVPVAARLHPRWVRGDLGGGTWPRVAGLNAQPNRACRSTFGSGRDGVVITACVPAGRVLPPGGSVDEILQLKEAAYRVLTVGSSGCSDSADRGTCTCPRRARRCHRAVPGRRTASTRAPHPPRAPRQRSDTVSLIWILTLRINNVATTSGGAHLRERYHGGRVARAYQSPCVRRPNAGGIYVIVGQVVDNAALN